MDTEKNLEITLAKKTYTIDMSEAFDSASEIQIIIDFIAEKFGRTDILLCSVSKSPKKKFPKRDFFAYTLNQFQEELAEEVLTFSREGKESWIIVYDQSMAQRQPGIETEAYTIKDAAALEDAVVALLKLNYSE